LKKARDEDKKRRVRRVCWLYLPMYPERGNIPVSAAFIKEETIAYAVPWRSFSTRSDTNGHTQAGINEK
jgi:hypothetical protein